MAENHLPGIPKKQQLLKSVLCCPLPTTLGCPQATGFSSQAQPQLAGLDEPETSCPLTTLTDEEIGPRDSAIWSSPL